MKKRLITGLSCTALATSILVFLATPWLPVVLTLFCAMAAYEILRVGQVKNKGILCVTVLCAAAAPAMAALRLFENLKLSGSLAFFLFVLALTVVTLFDAQKTKFEHILIAIYAGVLVPWGFSTIVRARTLLSDSLGAFLAQRALPHSPAIFVYFIFFMMCCAWVADTFAYFVGVKYGKHKLAPKISPGKSVEGAIGGVLGTILINALFALLFNAFFLKGVQVRWWVMALLTIPVTLISIVGDLTASVFKRNYGVKDYGKIFPGHGGIMDRLDSFLFVAPTVYGILYLAAGCDWVFLLK
jgi:phosphatidate cytidylyltransferase